MKKSRYSEEQIVRILKEGASGALTVAELCRKYSISEGSYYRWKSKYNGMDVSDVKKLKSLEDENRKLKQMLADQMLENRAMKAILEKEW